MGLRTSKGGVGHGLRHLVDRALSGSGDRSRRRRSDAGRREPQRRAESLAADAEDASGGPSGANGGGRRMTAPIEFTPTASERSSEPPVLDVRDLRVWYAGVAEPVRAVDGVSFSLR